MSLEKAIEQVARDDELLSLLNMDQRVALQLSLLQMRLRLELNRLLPGDITTLKGIADLDQAARLQVMAYVDLYFEEDFPEHGFVWVNKSSIRLLARP